MKSNRLLVSVPYALAVALVLISLLRRRPVTGPRESGGCFGRQQAVGGVAIAPDGALKNADEGAVRELQAARDADAQAGVRKTSNTMPSCARFLYAGWKRPSSSSKKR